MNGTGVNKFTCNLLQRIIFHFAVTHPIYKLLHGSDETLEEGVVLDITGHATPQIAMPEFADHPPS